MRRFPLAFLKALLIVLLGLFGTVAGSIAAVFLTPAGRGLAGRTLSEQLDQLVQGDVQVGAVGGPLWGGLEVDGLVVRDTAGDLVFEADRLAAHYHILDLLAGRILLTDVTVRGLHLVLERHRDGHWNIASILRASGDTGSGGAPPLVRFEGLTILDSELLLLQPWDPPDSMRTPRAAAAALKAERAHPGRLIEPGPEGYRKAVRFDRFGGHFDLLQVSSPSREPLAARFDSLAVRVSDPGLDLRNAAGEVELDDGRLTLALTDGALPATDFSGAGTVVLRGPAPKFDLRVAAPRVALRDARGFVPSLPDLTGSARLTLRTRPDGRLAADVPVLDLRDRTGGRATGRLTAVTGGNKPLALERLDLTLAALDPLVMSGWVDSIPLRGTLEGRVQADGALNALTIDADLIYRDPRVAGRPANHLSAAGRVRLGGEEGMTFDTLRLRESDLDLGTVRLFVPSNPLLGRVAVEGELIGPWKQVTWRGTAQHRDGDRPVSAVRGTVQLDTRTALTGFDVDVGLMPLVLQGLAGTWPEIKAEGDLRGSVKLHGTSERFAFVTDLHGQLGHVAGTGTVLVGPASVEGDSLALRFDSLDLSALAGAHMRTQLLGTFGGRIARDSAGDLTGRGALALGAGWIREVPIDSAVLTLTADRVTITVDTGSLRWPGGRVEAGGSIARTTPATGTLRFQGEAADLRVFDSLVAALFPEQADSALASQPLSGRAEFAVELTGALDSLAVDGRGSVRDLAWRRARLPAGRAEFRYGGGGAGPVEVAATVDTANWEGWTLGQTAVRASGRRDSLGWEVVGRLGPTDTVVAGGRWRTAGDTLDLAIDSLAAVLTAHRWELAGPSTARGIDGAWRVDSLVLLTNDGSGELRLAGVLPSSAPGSATLNAIGLDLRDVMGLFARDTVGVLGRASADLTIEGTARAPLMRGTFSLAEGGYRDFRAPYLQGALSYADRRLEATLLLWRTGRRALEIFADSVPLDLAFTGAHDRLVDGPLYVRATADSADLGLLEAFTRNLRRVRGGLIADVTVSGRWDALRMGGRIEVVDAAATLPGLGVRWEGMSARIHLAKDSVVIDTLVVRGGGGKLTATGRAHFERGRPPYIDSLDVRLDRFRAMDVRNYLTLVATGRMQVKGPVFGATLTGNGRADEGALYFADLVTKQIVDLNDPATADLIDTALVREARLGPSFSNRFIDSLRINSFRLQVGEDFWLRSADANVKLSGIATVNKLARNYRIDGTLAAERGQYTLKAGIVRTFDVERGTVRFLGTPDLNAELDLTAHHEVKPTDGTREFAMQAKITGTLLVPKLTLFNPDNPQMTETDMVSYLMFGRSSAALQGNNSAEGAQQQQAVSSALSLYILPALSSEIERTLISDLGVPVDFIQIRLGGVGTNSIAGGNTSLTTVSAGWRLGRQTYVALNAGLCNNNATDVSYRNLGASLEQRLHRDWRATLSVEPVFTCSSAPGTSSLATSSLYQLGLDLLWDREY
jgi:translocation-and-assembly-module (TAM) inner membrane subunit TamB-like protein